MQIQNTMIVYDLRKEKNPLINSLPSAERTVNDNCTPSKKISHFLYKTVTNVLTVDR